MQLETDAFQLKRMMRQDAHEKAFEMMVQGQRMYEQRMDRLIKEGEKKLNGEFAKKMEDQKINFRIAIAQKTNASRLEKMKKRNQCMEELKGSALYRLQNDYNVDNKQYQDTLKALIIQVSNSLTHFLCIHHVANRERVLYRA